MIMRNLRLIIIPVYLDDFSAVDLRLLSSAIYRFQLIRIRIS